MHEPGLEVAIALAFPAIYVLDVGLTFFTAVKASGVEIDKHRSIAVHYLQGELWIDVISALPFDLIMLLLGYISQGNYPIAANFWRAFKLLKLRESSRK